MQIRVLCAVTLTLLMAGMGGVANAAGPGPVAVPDFDLEAYLDQSPALHETAIDTSGLRIDVSDYTVKTTAYDVIGAVGYKDTPATNPSDYPIVVSSAARTITDWTTTSYTNTHTVEFGQETSWEATIKVPFAEVTAGTSVSFGYSFANGQTWTQQRTDAVTFSPQTVNLPPWSAARIEEWYDQGKLTAQVNIVGRTSGSVRFTKCGRTVEIPIGQVLAMRDKFDLPPLPSWITPSGNDVLIENQVTFSTVRATRQAVRVSNATPPTKPTPTATPDPTITSAPVAKPAPVSKPAPVVVSTPTLQVGETRLPMSSVNLASPDAQAVGSRPASSTGGAKDADTLLASLLTCPPTPADGALLLGTNGDVYDPAWGSLLGAPDGVRFRSASGLNESGSGLYVSAITADGTPYWRSPGSDFVKVTSPGVATMTADGTVLLGSDRRAYFAGGGRVPSSSGVTFSDVSGVHVPGKAVFVSAITRDGQAYWYNNGGSLQRVSVPVRVTDTVDGLALLGADGNVYTASNGALIGNPTKARMIAVSATHKYQTGIRYSAIDEDGNAYWSINGASFTRVPVAVPVRSTADGTVLLGADGRAYNTASGEAYPSPTGVRFTAVAGVTVWGVGYYVSAVGADGKAYWSNQGGMFRPVDY